MTPLDLIQEARKRVRAGQPVDDLHRQLVALWPGWRCNCAAFVYKLRVQAGLMRLPCPFVLVPVWPDRMRDGAVHIAVKSGASATLAKIFNGPHPDAKHYDHVFVLERSPV